ncbi:hypothetical protein BDD14_6214 [Edaphobacter modestus]|uniref:Uncharacterized protein n=1 Tax=Edaphobacter modestus TaxID=388466 RepID=A0A4Q7XZ17_9BACT|nr:hypothetical protein BDD14_6214 [Edaphobacter modestus]
MNQNVHAKGVFDTSFIGPPVVMNLWAEIDESAQIDQGRSMNLQTIATSSSVVRRLSKVARNNEIYLALYDVKTGTEVNDAG